MFAPFSPFWIRKPVPVIPFHHHPSAHPQLAHHQNFNAPLNFINFRGTNHSAVPHESPEKSHKKEYFDNVTIQSIKNELLSSNSANPKTVFSEPQLQNLNSSYDNDDDFNNDNIDVETDSDNDQHVNELKQLNNFNSDDVSIVKSEEWNKIMRNSTQILLKTHQPHSPTPPPSNDKTTVSANKIDSREINAKRTIFEATEDDENEYYNEQFTDRNLLNLSEKKRGKYGNAKGFSIENLIGRMVDDR